MNRKQRRAQERTGAAPASMPRPQTAPLVEEAMRHLQAGRPREAEQLYRHVLLLDPRHAHSLHNLGAIAHTAGHHSAAADWYQLAIDVDGGCALFHFSLGQALEQLPRFQDALAAYRAAVRLEPRDAAARGRLGSVLLHLGQPEQAELQLRKALTQAPPQAAEAWSNLGWAIELQGRCDEAAECYRQANALLPDLAEHLGNLGSKLLGQQRFEEAIRYYQRALALKPDLAALHDLLGTAQLAIGDHAAAIACSRKAIALQPDDASAHSNLIFALNFDPCCTAEQQQAERRAWYNRHASVPAEAAPAHPNSPLPERRLRIGYLSAHFRRQASAYAFAGVLLHHDDAQFEVFCYSDTAGEDDLTQALRRKVPRWRDVTGLSDDLLAARIREDGIDICVDLVGHMQGQRLLVMARKPAPVQVTAWGEPTGTGIPQIDWLLADPVLVPQRLRPLLSEKVADLPCFLSIWTPEALPAPGPLPALRNGHVTFGSFNRFYKLTDATLHRWAAVIEAVPGSRLLVKSQGLSEPANRDRLTAALVRAGIDPGIASMRGQSDRASHLAAYQEVDLALDPYPHGGGMTTLESLAMGVPVLTVPGETISSRLAAACLSAVGLAEFIADDPGGLAAHAARTTADLDGLAALRAGLPARLSNSLVGNAAVYTRAVETAYRQMWRQWCGSSHVHRGQ